MKRAIYAGIGWICVALGAAGIILPLLPTTPFIIVAAWAFARSSPTFQAWLDDHKVFGPHIRDWRSYGVIPLYAKLLAVAMMSTSLALIAVFSDVPVAVIAVVGVVMAAVALFLFSRPSAPPDAA